MTVGEYQEKMAEVMTIACPWARRERMREIDREFILEDGFQYLIEPGMRLRPAAPEAIPQTQQMNFQWNPTYRVLRSAQQPELTFDWGMLRRQQQIDDEEA